MNYPVQPSSVELASLEEQARELERAIAAATSPGEEVYLVHRLHAVETAIQAEEWRQRRSAAAKLG